MKNTTNTIAKRRSLLAIVALVALTLILFASCGNDNSNNGDGNDIGNSKLSISYLPSGTANIIVKIFNNAKAPTTNPEYISISDTNQVGYGHGKSSPVSLALPSDSTISFTDTGSRLVCINVYNKDNVFMGEKFTMANFTNGSATVNWNTMTDAASLP